MADYKFTQVQVVLIQIEDSSFLDIAVMFHLFCLFKLERSFNKKKRRNEAELAAQTLGS